MSIHLGGHQPAGGFCVFFSAVTDQRRQLATFDSPRVASGIGSSCFVGHHHNPKSAQHIGQMAIPVHSLPGGGGGNSSSSAGRVVVKISQLDTEHCSYHPLPPRSINSSRPRIAPDGSTDEGSRRGVFNCELNIFAMKWSLSLVPQRTVHLETCK